MKLSPTSEATPPLEQAAPRVAAQPLRLLVPLLLVCLALVPRTTGLGDFLTTDEAYHWIERTTRFNGALAEGRWADTLQTGHPGVTLMWLGSLGLQLERLALAVGAIAPPDRLGHLAWLRLGPALFHGLALLVGYALLRRLVRPAVALVAAILWATSPYLVAHGRLLHLDGLLADGVTLALLACLVARQAPRAWPWLLGAGVATGFALLTKGPALVVLPVLGLVLFFGARPPDPRAAGLQFVLSRLIWSLPRFLLLLAVAAAVVFACWPALWVAPGAASTRYLDEIVGNGGRPNGDGQFFLGQAIADPGPWFYLVANLYRTTPLELLGLLAAAPLGVMALFARIDSRRQRGDRSPTEATLLLLLAFVAFWTLVMTLGPKKFDRYVLPTWPALLILAAAGLVQLVERTVRFMPWLRRQNGVGTRQAAIVLCLVCQGATLFWYHPHYLSYYNPLLGGGQAAQRLFLIGWGEGMEQVGAYLRSRPDLGEGQVVSALPPTLQPFVPVPVQNIAQIDGARPNYAVVYLESLQREAFPAIYERIRATMPLTTITIHGIDYAQIHQLPRPFAQPVGARFGAGLVLAGMTMELRPAMLLLTPAWDVRGPVGGDYLLFVHLLASDGQRVAEVAVAPGGAARPATSAWQTGEQIAVPIPISLPDGLAPGDYTVVAGLFDPITGVRLPLAVGPAAPAALAGADAALLGSVRLGEE